MKIENKVPKALTFSLLKVLSDAQFHSGTRLAKQFYVSAGTVHNAVKEMEEYGLTVLSVPKKGYQLLDAPQWLIADKIELHLKKQNVFRIKVLEQTHSSNTDLLQQAAQGIPGGNVLAVEYQSAGRGRLGRSWQGELGKSLTFSLLWRFQTGLPALAGLSLAVGLALLRVLRQLGGKEIQLKWPNDLVSPRGKLAGILLEAQGKTEGPCYVVIGIGINVKALKSQINQDITNLEQELSKVPERNQLLALLLDSLAEMLHDFAKNGFAPMATEWEAAQRDQHKAVNLLMPDGTMVAGIVHGVSSNGALRVETATGLREFQNGEISLREAS